LTTIGQSLRDTRQSWTYCDCGKVWSSSPEEAGKKAAVAATLNGDTKLPSIYPCAVDPTAWHWTSHPMDGRCPCGRAGLGSATEAARSAERANRGRDHERIRARPYTCPHGGEHWAWYPVDKKFRQCPDCGTVAFPTREDTLAVGEQMGRCSPRYHHTPRRCPRGMWHVTATRTPPTTRSTR